ncbi:MAG: mechanosensitive ion channel [Myxococcales bacterium]|nr:mechanosensitive ion channel [Myxococcales bacterium]
MKALHLSLRALAAAAILLLVTVSGVPRIPIGAGWAAAKRPKTPPTVAPKPKGVRKPGRPRTLHEMEADVQKVRDRFRTLMRQWESLRALDLKPVPWLKPVDLQANLKKQLGLQYRTLLRMRRATGQWDTYWKEEQKIAAGFLALYRDAAPLVGELARAFVVDLAALRSKTFEAHRRSDKGLAAVTLWQKRIRGRIRELETAQKARREQLATDSDLITDLERRAKLAEEALASAREGQDPALIKSATTKKTEADAVLAAARKTIVDLRKAIERERPILEQAQRFWLAATFGVAAKDPQKLVEIAPKLATTRTALQNALLRLSTKLGDALAIAEDFEELRPASRGDAKLFRRLHALLQKHLKALAKARAEVKTASDRWANVRVQFQSTVDAGRDDVRHKTSALRRAAATLDQTQKLLAPLEKRLAEAKRKNLGKLVEHLTSQLEAQRKDIDAQKVRITKQRAALDATKRELTLLRLYRDVAENRAIVLADPGLKTLALGWSRALKTSLEAPIAAHLAVRTWLLRHRRFLSVLSIGERYTGRIETLKGWQTIARAARKNLVGALTAINLALRAVDDRLRRDVELRPVDEKSKSSDLVVGERSPWAEHRAALLRLERRRVSVLLQERRTALNQRFLSGQLEATKTAARVQGQKVQLARKEQTFVGGVYEHAAHSVFEHRTWRAVWKAYAERAKTRLETLSAQHRETLRTVKLLQIEEQYYKYQKQLVTEELKKVKAAIATQESKRWRAILGSVGDWFKRNTIDFLLMLLLALIMYRLTGWLEHRLIERAKKRHVDNRATAQQIETLSRIAAGVAKFLVIGLATIWFLNRVGVNVLPVLGGAAVFGLAISFGSQNLVRDVVTGFFILLEKHYAVGDMIEIGGVSGTVEILTLRRTVIRSRDGKAHIFPNGFISAVTNRTLGWSRVCVQIGVAYSSDLAQVQEVCDATGEAMYADPNWRNKLLAAPRFQGLTELADSALIVLVAGEIRPHHYFEITFELNRRLKEAFDKAGVEIPFPQRDLHLRSSGEATQNPLQPGQGQKAAK